VARAKPALDCSPPASARHIFRNAKREQELEGACARGVRREREHARGWVQPARRVRGSRGARGTSVVFARLAAPRRHRRPLPPRPRQTRTRALSTKTGCC
jgi:hypothetical protein